MNLDAPLFAILATPVPVPEQVDRSRWPVHVTVAGNFAVNESAEAAIVALVESIALETPSFDVVLGPSALFGVNEDFRVLLAPHPSFDRMHTQLATALTQLAGFAAAEPEFWLEGYRSHATLGDAVHVADGETLAIRMLTLVSMQGPTATRVAAVELDAPF